MSKCQKFKCDILSNFQTMWQEKSNRVRMNINSNSVAPQKWLQQLEMWCSHKLKLMEFPLSSPYCFNFAKWPSYFNNLDHYYLGKNIYFKTEDPTQLRDPLQLYSMGKFGLENRESRDVYLSRASFKGCYNFLYEKNRRPNPFQSWTIEWNKC